MKAAKGSLRDAIRGKRKCTPSPRFVIGQSKNLSWGTQGIIVRNNPKGQYQFSAIWRRVTTRIFNVLS